MEEFRDKEPYDYLQFKRGIEFTKRSFDIDINKSIILQCPRSLWKLCQAQIQVPDFPYFTLEQDKLKIENRGYSKIFQQVTEKIVKEMGGALTNLKSVNCILLVGGFSESSYVRNLFRSKFPSLTFVWPEGSEMAVLQGAVRYGMNPNAISSRILRYTYGIAVMKEFDERKHFPEKKKIIDGKSWCKDVFSVLARQGEELKEGKEVVKSFKAVEATANIMSHDIYYSTESFPDYVTDRSCKKLGKFTVKLNQSALLKQKEYEQIAVFGGTELSFKVHAPDSKDITGTYTFQYECDQI